MKSRPLGVPSDAKWNAADDEWELGRTLSGRSVGEWKWWRTDGTIVCHSNFDEDGNLHGRCRRFHPDGQISMEADFLRGKRHGKGFHTRCLSGPSPEDVHLASVTSLGAYRIDQVYDHGRCVPLFTLYDAEGTRAPIRTESGLIRDFGGALPKLVRGTAFTVVNSKSPETARLVNLAGPPIAMPVTDWLHFLCEASAGSWDTIRFAFRDGSLTVLSADQLPQLVLTVDFLAARLAAVGSLSPILWAEPDLRDAPRGFKLPLRRGESTAR